MGRALNILVECRSEKYAHELARKFYKTLYECGIRGFQYNDFYKAILFDNNDIFRFTSWNNENAHKGFRGKVVSEYDIENLISAIPLMREFYK